MRYSPPVFRRLILEEVEQRLCLKSTLYLNRGPSLAMVGKDLIGEGSAPDHSSSLGFALAVSGLSDEVSRHKKIVSRWKESPGGMECPIEGGEAIVWYKTINTLIED